MKRLAVLAAILGPPIVSGVLAALGWLPMVATIAFIVAILISVPVAIAVALDWYGAPLPPNGKLGAARQIMRVPVFLLGVAACVIGTAVLGWVAYNVLWARQPQFRSPGAVLGAVQVGAMVAMVFLGVRWIGSAVRPRSGQEPVEHVGEQQSNASSH